MTAPSPADIVKGPAPRVVKQAPEGRHHRGDVWMVASDPAQPAVGTEIWSNRPAVVVSNNVLNSRSGFAQIVYLSTATRKRSGPTHVEIPAPDGHGTAMALCEQIHTVDASRLRKKLDVVSAESMRDLDSAMSLSLSIGRNPNTHGAFRKWEEHIKLNGIDIAQEIAALAGRTTDERVAALTRALELVATESDSWRSLYEAGLVRTTALDEVAAALHPIAA